MVIAAMKLKDAYSLERKFNLSHNLIINKVRLKILQARLQQYVNQELLNVQDGFRKGRRIRDQVANIC